MRAAAGLTTTLIVFPFVAPPRRRALIRRWSARFLALLDVDARRTVASIEIRGNVLIVANHVSWLDVLVLNAHDPRASSRAERSRCGRWRDG